MHDRAVARGRLLDLFVSVAMAAALLWPLLAMSTAPGFRHDWTWPVTQASTAHYMDVAMHAWLPDGIGEPNVTPPAMLPLAVNYLLMRLLGVKFALDVVYLLLAVMAAFGAARAARAMFPEQQTSGAIAAIAYIGFPAFSDVVIAGHVGLVYTWAALPWVLYCAVKCTRSAVATAFCILSACVAVSQIQYALMVPVLLLGVLAARPDKRRAQVVVAAIAVVILVSLRSIVPLFFAEGPKTYEPTNLQWQQAQSTPIAKALLGVGYEAGYDDVPNTSYIALVGRYCNGILATLAFVALLLSARRSRIAKLLLVMWVCGATMLACLRGPAAALFHAAYVHSLYASAFRETFHFVPLVVLPLSIGCALIVSNVFRSGTFGVTIPLCIATVLSCTPLVTGAVGRYLHAYDAGALSTVLQNVAQVGPNQRVVIAPARQPAYDAKDDSYGVDPLSEYPIGSIWTLRSYIVPQVGLPSLASDLLERGQIRDAAELYARLSVASIILRPQVRPGSVASAEPMSTLHLGNAPRVQWPSIPLMVRAKPDPLVYGSSIPLLIGGDLTLLEKNKSLLRKPVVFMRQRPGVVAAGLPFDVSALDRDDALIAAGCATLQMPRASVVDAWPTHAWVGGYRFGFQDPVIDSPLSYVVVTQKGNLPPPFAGNRVAPMLSAVIDGSGKESFRWAGDYPRPSATAAIAVAGRLMQTCSNGIRSIRAPGSVRVLSFTRTSNEVVRGQFYLKGRAGTLVFTDAFAENWNLYIDGQRVKAERHVRVFGTINGWLIDRLTGRHSFEIRYEDHGAFYALSLVCLTTYALLAAFICAACVLPNLSPRTSSRSPNRRP